ncbi:hypothetical protein ACFVY1_25930 [Streptomyces sp. NPDC058293]|uniref:hypothetical protein n=1 Tax=Streptomyces sp. NPDC058293 TaxID=3346429 RepID=UPI0036EA87EE
MQLYELEAWLGDNHGLTEEQLDELLTQAVEINERYADPDDQAERDAALSAAYRLQIEPAESVIADYSGQLATARSATAAASAGLQQIAQNAIVAGQFTEAGFARAVGVDRMTVRKWVQDQKDRVLFNEALFQLVRIHDMPADDQEKLTAALGIRDTGAQAAVLLAALDMHSVEQLPEEQQALIARAVKRARQVV